MAKGFKTGGRRPGVPNKVTQQAREAIALFVENNVDRLQEWLDEIAQEEGPKVAFDCFMDVVEYHVPKLARMEHAGDADAPVRVLFEWKQSES